MGFNSGFKGLIKKFIKRLASNCRLCIVMLLFLKENFNKNIFREKFQIPNDEVIKPTAGYFGSQKSPTHTNAELSEYSHFVGLFPA
jgi:hypothetical protein